MATNPKCANVELYAIYSEGLNSEREAIWARYNALLVANSLMMVLLPQTREDIVIATAGLILCLIWFLIHLNGYSRFHRRLAVLHERFEFEVPVSTAGGSWSPFIDPIYLGSNALIVVVGFFYLYLNATIREWTGSTVQYLIHH